MPNVYLKDKTKQLLDQVSEADKRTLEGEIDFLLSERAKELSSPLDSTPSMSDNSESTEAGQVSQEEN